MSSDLKRGSGDNAWNGLQETGRDHETTWANAEHDGQCRNETGATGKEPENGTCLQLTGGIDTDANDGKIVHRVGTNTSTQSCHHLRYPSVRLSEDELGGHAERDAGSSTLEAG